MNTATFFSVYMLFTVAWAMKNPCNNSKKILNVLRVPLCMPLCSFEVNFLTTKVSKDFTQVAKDFLYFIV
jgi:hypothetical protein